MNDDNVKVSEMQDMDKVGDVNCYQIQKKKKKFKLGVWVRSTHALNIKLKVLSYK